MKLKMIYALGTLAILAFTAFGCGNNSSSKGTSRRQQAISCDPNFNANCANQYYGNNGYNTGNGNCPVNSINTSYGCLPTTNCPANYGFHQQSNMCYPAVQATGTYGQAGYQDPYYQGYGYQDPYYNSGAYQNYNGYNQSYPNQNNYYGY